MDGADDKRPGEPDRTSRQRLDKWLFFTRMAKSRSVAQDWIGAGHVRVNDQAVRQSAHMVRGGDRVEIVVDRRHHILVVLSGGARRGPFEEARLLYQDLSPPPATKLSAYELAQRLPGSGRPTKKDRRALDRLTGED